MSCTARIVALAALSCLGASLAQGRARPAPVPAAARALFKQGRAFQEAGAWADAIKEYSKAYALAPLPALLYNIGQCHRLAGDKPAAIAAYQRYLDAEPDGTLADEARAHVAALKLRIQVEEAERAKRKAQEEAEAAKRRARELEEARARADAQRSNKESEQARLQRLAAEVLRRQAEMRQAEERQRRQRMAETQHKGKPLRSAGIAAIVVGSVALAAGAVASGFYLIVYKNLSEWDRSTDDKRWERDGDLRIQRNGRSGLIGFGTGGAVLLVGGIVLYRLGVARRQKALEAAERSVDLRPILGPGSVGLALDRRF